jgi:hypothetical protein
VYGLPGTDVSIAHYNLEKTQLSTDAINCLKTNSSESYFSLANEIEKINCNSKTDRVEFCECVSIVSNNGLELSKEEKDEVQTLVKGTAGTIFENYLNDQVDNIENVDLLAQALLESPTAINCLGSTDQNDELSVLQKLKYTKGALLTPEQKIKINVLNTLEGRLISNGPVAGDYKTYLDKVEATQNTFSKASDVHVKDFDIYDWEHLSASPILRLVASSSDNKRAFHTHISTTNNELELSVVPIDIFSITFPEVVDKKFATGVNNFKRAENINFAETLLNRECMNLRTEFKSVLSSSFDEVKASLKENLFSPEKEEGKQTIQLFADMFDEKLSTNKSTMGDKLFNIDKFYCQQLKTKLGLSQSVSFIKKSEKVSKQLSEIDLRLKTETDLINDLYNDIDERKKSVQKHMAHKKSLMAHLKLLTEISNGSFKKVVDDNEVFNFDDPRVQDLFEQCKGDHVCDNIRLIGSEDPNLEYSHFSKFAKGSDFKEITKKIAHHNSEIKRENIAINELGLRRSTAMQREVVLKAERKKLLDSFSEEFGEEGVQQVVAKASGVVNKTIGRYNINDTVVKDNQSSRKRKILKGVISEIGSLASDKPKVQVKVFGDQVLSSSSTNSLSDFF